MSNSFGKPVVVKADGLAAGKGVIVCANTTKPKLPCAQIMLEREFGAAGDRVVIEERLSGAEISALAFCDGKTVAMMPLARDHKRVCDGDQGPNTGGMGAYAPVPDISARANRDDTRDACLQPAVRGMAAEGMPYVGVLFAGLMLTPDGVRVLEFNCRFGDPETQVILPLLDGDFAEILVACTDGTLAASISRAGAQERAQLWCWRRRAIRGAIRKGCRSRVWMSSRGRDCLSRRNNRKGEAGGHGGRARPGGQRTRRVADRSAWRALIPMSSISFRRDALPPRHRAKSTKG